MPRQVTPRKEEIKRIEDLIRARCDRYLPRSRWPENPRCKSGHPSKLSMVYGFKQANTIPNAGRVARVCYNPTRKCSIEYITPELTGVRGNHIRALLLRREYLMKLGSRAYNLKLRDGFHPAIPEVPYPYEAFNEPPPIPPSPPVVPLARRGNPFPLNDLWREKANEIRSRQPAESSPSSQLTSSSNREAESIHFSIIWFDDDKTLPQRFSCIVPQGRLFCLTDFPGITSKYRFSSGYQLLKPRTLEWVERDNWEFPQKATEGHVYVYRTPGVKVCLGLDTIIVEAGNFGTQPPIWKRHEVPGSMPSAIGGQHHASSSSLAPDSSPRTIFSEERASSPYMESPCRNKGKQKMTFEVFELSD